MKLGGFLLEKVAPLARLIGRSATTLIWASALSVFGFSVPTANAANVEAVRLWRAPDHTRVVLDLSSAPDFSSFSLENPTALSSICRRVTSPHRCASYHWRARRSNRSVPIRKGTDLRLVFDLDAAVPSLFSLPPGESIGYRIVIDFYDEIAVSEPSPVLSVESFKGRRDIVIAIDPGHGGED